MKSLPTLSLLLAATLAGCASSTPLPAPATPALPGNWTLQAAPGLPPPPGTVQLSLRSSPPREGGQATLEVSGFSGVNHYRGQGNVDAAGHRLVIGQLATTRMAGPEDRLRFEGAYLQQLEKVGSYDWQDGDTLVLRTLSGESLTFSRSGL